MHRDVKPANIILVKNGAKVLDFGLAKSASDEMVTAANSIVGTPAYMAPEQKRGDDAGARTDIYALGLVLAEMATGTRGSTESLTGFFAHVVRRCLADSPDDRWQSAADIQGQLEWLQTQSPVPQPPSRSAPWTMGLLAALAAAVAAGALVVWTRSHALSPSPASSLAQQFDLSVDFDSDGFHYVPEPSPDGRYLAFLSRSTGNRSALDVRALDDSVPHVLAGTENARTFFWSADSKWLAFVVDDKIKKIAPTGGAVQTIATVAGAVQEPTWGSRGDILYRRSNREPLSHLTENGGPSEIVTTLDRSRTENSHRGQQFLPDGRRFLFTARCADRSMNALYLGSLDTKTVRRLMPIDSEARFVSHGLQHGVVVYQRDGALVGRRLNLDREEVEGEPFVILDHVGFIPSGLILNFAASADGRVAVTKAVNASIRRSNGTRARAIRSVSSASPGNGRNSVCRPTARESPPPGSIRRTAIATCSYSTCAAFHCVSPRMARTIGIPSGRPTGNGSCLCRIVPTVEGF